MNRRLYYRIREGLYVGPVISYSPSRLAGEALVTELMSDRKITSDGSELQMTKALRMSQACSPVIFSRENGVLIC